MKTQAAEGPHLQLRIGGVTVLLLGTYGIAAVMAWMPAWTDDRFSTLPAGPIDAQARVTPARTEGGARVRVKCAECGIVASTREVEQPGAGIDPGTAGGAARGGRNEMPGKSAKSYEVTVRMRDGSSRAFMDANPANWRAGERVILIEAASRSID